MSQNKIYEYEYLNEQLGKLRDEELKAFLLTNRIIDFDFLDLEIYNKEKTKKQKAIDSLYLSKLNSKIVLTNQQIELLSIISEDNVFISAPTSFGKTFIILEYIMRNIDKLNNVVFIVPTIALLNELLKKMYNWFSNYYNICINSFESIEKKNIFIFVPERSDNEFLNKVKEIEIDLLVFDEIYKLRAEKKKDVTSDDRLILMNKVYLSLLEKAKKKVLLGPFIESINFDQTNLDVVKYYTNYMPIYNKVIKIGEDEWHNKIGKEKTLVFFNKPENIYKKVNYILENINIKKELEEYYSKEIDHLKKEIGAEWYVIELMKRGIGIHHGKTPMYLRKFFETEYNIGRINTILCTNTLMEGINTPTNNLLIVDNTRSTFELNNLMGRVGRLNPEHPKVGTIYICNDSAYDRYMDKNKWLKMTILAENKTVFTNDEMLFLNKKTDDTAKQNEFDEKLNKIEEAGITKEIMKNYDVSFDKVYKFVVDRFKEKFTNAKSVYNCICLSFDIIGKRISNRFSISNFDGLQSSINYLPYKTYTEDLLNKQSIKTILRSFNDNYKNTNKNNMNLFIDAILELSNYIKFTLIKIANYLELFSLTEINSCVRKFVSLLTNFTNLDNQSKIFSDLGIEEQDYKYLSSLMKKDISLSTSNIIRQIKYHANEIINANVSPFTKHNIRNL